ncbi:MAG: CCA tRNA nucleotidyltransferase [Clostridia bacterium]|nr:CCA tRNA nucleotidyltransferase [Clostridia bacterium]
MKKASVPAPLPDIPCPAAVRALLDLFSAHGEGAYLVGGCVRDALMGKAPHDWDVAVTTVPEDTEAICASAGLETVPTGIAHGTVTVLVPADDASAQRGSSALRIPVECTTCRTEGGYSDGRHPDAVAFTGRLEDDLSRRDFTVNAMAAAPGADGQFRVIDLFGGQRDLADKVIRCVGDPDTRLCEDALRVLRGVRFSVRLGFDPEPETKAALARCAPGLARISRERVRAELEGILTGPDPDRGVRLMDELGITAYVFPAGLSPYSSAATSSGRLASLPDFKTRLAALLWGLPRAAQNENLSSLRLSNDIRRAVTEMLSFDVCPFELSRRFARGMRRKFGALAADTLRVLRAVTPASDPKTRRELGRLISYVRASEAAGDCVTVGDLALNGDDLRALGAAPGRDTGLMLARLLDDVTERPSANTKQRLSALVRRYLTEPLR